MTLLRVAGSVLFFNGSQFCCAVGKGGFSEHKREGDGCTPTGTFALRECWYRPDRLPKPPTGLPVQEIHEDDGWCDDPASPAYNRPVPLPYTYSHERLWREDRVYDLIVPLGYNDDPPVPGKGSAIFLHLAHEDYAPTEGCVALALADMLELLPHLTPESFMEIMP